MAGPPKSKESKKQRVKDKHHHHIKFLKPRLEMASNLNNPIARGSPKLPQPGPKVANRPNDLYVLYMTETRADP